MLVMGRLERPVKVRKKRRKKRRRDAGIRGLFPFVSRENDGSHPGARVFKHSSFTFPNIMSKEITVLSPRSSRVVFSKFTSPLSWSI